jgi:hypothetical protein
MAKLIYSMLVSLDGYTEDEHGHFGWGAPEDAEVHSYINKRRPGAPGSRPIIRRVSLPLLFCFGTLTRVEKQARPCTAFSHQQSQVSSLALRGTWGTRPPERISTNRFIG